MTRLKQEKIFQIKSDNNKYESKTLLNFAELSLQVKTLVYQI